MEERLPACVVNCMHNTNIVGNFVVQCYQSLGPNLLHHRHSNVHLDHTLYYTTPAWSYFSTLFAYHCRTFYPKNSVAALLVHTSRGCNQSVVPAGTITTTKRRGGITMLWSTLQRFSRVMTFVTNVWFDCLLSTVHNVPK